MNNWNNKAHPRDDDKNRTGNSTLGRQASSARPFTGVVIHSARIQYLNCALYGVMTVDFPKIQAVNLDFLDENSMLLTRS